jgi:hypothetical protein
MLLAAAALLGLAIALAIYGSYQLPLVRYLGKASVNVLVRLSAFIRACIDI